MEYSLVLSLRNIYLDIRSIVFVVVDLCIKSVSELSSVKKVNNLLLSLHEFINTQ